MRQSLRILKQAFKTIPEGPVRLKLGPPAQGPRRGDLLQDRGGARGAGLPPRQRRLAEALQAEDERPQLPEHDTAPAAAQGCPRRRHTVDILEIELLACECRPLTK